MQIETVARLAASYEKLGVKNVADVLGIPKNTDAGTRARLSMLTNLEVDRGYVLLITPPSANENMSVLIQKTAASSFNKLGEITSSNVYLGYIQAGDEIHAFLSETPLSDGIIARNLGSKNSLIDDSHDAGHKILSLGWLKVGGVSSRSLSGIQVLKLALAQEDVFVNEADFVLKPAKLPARTFRQHGHGGTSADIAAPAVPGGATDFSGGFGSAPSKAPSKPKGDGLPFDFTIGLAAEFEWGASSDRPGGGLGFKGITIFDPDKKVPIPVDPLGGNGEGELGPGFKIIGDGNNPVDGCLDGTLNFPPRRNDLELPPKEPPTDLERTMREGFQQTLGGGAIETPPVTPKSPVVPPIKTGGIGG